MWTRGVSKSLTYSASVQVSAPLGQYDKDRLVNIGNNRWSLKPDIGISKAWGAFTVELSNGVTLFSENDDYFGGKMRSVVNSGRQTSYAARSLA